MSDTLDWVCNEIGVSRKLVLSRRRERPLVLKRWTIMYFFRLLGKSTPWIGKILIRDHSVVDHCIHTIKEQERKRAFDAYEKYMKDIVGRDISELKIENIVPTITIKVPNYHTGAIELKEITVGEYEQMQKRRVGYWWQRKL